ncbi:MAG: Ig-like domain-containing protein [Flavobacteriaceae bacterium]|nr:Ig-like domain-containing protein [Flavobacteriaceae bacterium]MDG1063475.1 Ig-like domain-containing protein [Flavobacteriaceae bacterium]
MKNATHSSSKLRHYKVSFLGFTAFCFALVSCSDDDQQYTPLDIRAVADQAEVYQNASVTLDILANDANVPIDGQILLDGPSKGTASITQHNNLGDAELVFVPNSGAIGEDTFAYSVCDAFGQQCSSASITINILPVSPVQLDLSNVPYPKLSDYNFFEGPLSDLSPVYGVLPYEPISKLFSDYAKKKRFVWMPENVSATYISDDALLDFPTGSVLIKAFYYDNVLPNIETKILETRLLIKQETEWIFADYIWDQEQQEAYLDVEGYGANIPVEWLENGVAKEVNYRVPSQSQCYTCHKSYQLATPIGPKPQSLNGLYDFDEGASNQLQKWQEMGYLDNSLPQTIETVVDWSDDTQPLDLRVRSYFDINCSSCHSDSGHCDYRSLRMNFNLSDDLANLGVCVDPDTPIPGYENDKIIEPGDPLNSILYFRLHTTLEEYRMPLLGRSLPHDEALLFIEEWILNLNNTCD